MLLYLKNIHLTNHFAAHLILPPGKAAPLATPQPPLCMPLINPYRTNVENRVSS